MLQFNKLRLSGFKSFVDAIEIPIEPGLTGIVGPNGCGKSNLVEALRWAMGETSAKQMRGSEMDDVIFNGTANRPSRNIAEVVLGLDNSARSAPAMFNDNQDLEISRRIERGSGSTYRVNGREVRARDVQLLFADSATGARSTALVSQGRVGAVINAKPAARRALLEEAAGITGLHSRRHEAELRLNAAEANLTRLEDILGTLDVQLQSLKKQVRQATRYRNISEHIRKAEANLFLLRWRAATAELEQNRERLTRIVAAVNELTGRAAAAVTRQGETAAALPALRQAEVEAAAELQRLVIARDGLEAESQRVEEARRDAETRLQQVAADIERETALGADAEAAVARLAGEHARLEAANHGEEEARAEAARRLAEATHEANTLEERLSRLTEQIAADEARAAALTRRIEELNERRQRLAARAAEVASQRAALDAEGAELAEITVAETALDEARKAAEQGRSRAEQAETARVQASEAEIAAVAGMQSSAATVARLDAEAGALAELLEIGEGQLWPPLIDSLQVEAGFEAALGAALGDDLSVPADEPAPVHWRTFEPFAAAPALPGGVAPLSRFVTGAPALGRRLSQVGVVADENEGRRLHGELVQGQRLVTRDGALWRWDGYTVSVGAATAATTRLEQRNRLAELRTRLAGARTRLAAAEAHAAQARAIAAAAATTERASRDDARAKEAAYAESREAAATLRQRAAERDSRRVALAEAAQAIAADAADADTRIEEASGTLAALPAAEDRRELAGELRTHLAEARARHLECQGAHDHLAREAEARRRRLDEIAGELTTWQQRRDGAQGRLVHLTERRQRAGEELERLAARPAEIEVQRRSLLTAVEAAEAKRAAAADRLAEAEARLSEADRAAKEAEAELGQSREEKVRREAAVGQSEQLCLSLQERIAERLGCAPDDLGEIAGIRDDAVPPEIEAMERRLERLLRERDTMGPVNLRAEHESMELAEQIETLEAERGDLIKAIEKLRQAIKELNREGRERLLASFAEVDRHFQELFLRLFGGGRAHLQLTDSEDPLEAGLEIMASPPGKRLQVLSLLSGGEQALAALALLFAVFLTNPAPICVLDEVDAPLDDANVDRFCRLVEEIALSTRTRFLIITHHRMTMARMDRLFGVTMAERGVSQLVSVDLRQAERLRATA